MGVGYAVVTGIPLVINGTAQLDDFVVVFDDSYTPIITDNTGNSRISAYTITSGGTTTATEASNIITAI